MNRPAVVPFVPTIAATVMATYHHRSEYLRRARSIGRHTEQQWSAMVAFFGRCVACGDTGCALAKDHVISVYAGGHDGIENLQPLCSPCNGSKGKRCLDFRPPGHPFGKAEWFGY